jgi:hypothetical protein
MRRLCLLIASLTISGCASFTTPSTPPTKPQLDSELARPCDPIPKPERADYDDWEDRYIELVGMYAICSGRHRKAVGAWPK